MRSDANAYFPRLGLREWGDAGKIVADFDVDENVCRDGDMVVQLFNSHPHSHPQSRTHAGGVRGGSFMLLAALFAAQCALALAQDVHVPPPLP